MGKFLICCFCLATKTMYIKLKSVPRVIRLKITKLCMFWVHVEVHVLKVHCAYLFFLFNQVLKRNEISAASFSVTHQLIISKFDLRYFFSTDVKFSILFKTVVVFMIGLRLRLLSVLTEIEIERKRERTLCSDVN